MVENMEQDELRRRMRIARELAQLDQLELASKLHDAGWIKSGGREQISNVENGKRTLPPKVLEAIEEICKVPPGFLTDETVQLVTVQRTVLVTGRTVTVSEDHRHEVMDVEEAYRRGLLTKEAVAAVLGQGPPPSDSHLPSDPTQQQGERSSGEQGQ